MRVNDRFMSSGVYVFLAGVAGALATLGAVLLTAWRAAEADRAQRRLDAYADLLVAAGTVLSTYRQLRDAVSPDSGKCVTFAAIWHGVFSAIWQGRPIRDGGSVTGHDSCHLAKPSVTTVFSPTLRR